MTVEEMVKYLRMNVSIQDPSITTSDSAYLSMSDDDIKLYITTVMTRNFPEILSLDYLPPENIYPLMLLSKKELYYTLAIKEAPMYDIGADNNNYLKRSQRFEHYMKLIEQVDKEYQEYLDNGGAGANTLASFDVRLNNRYATKRNYEKGAVPAPLLYIVSISETSVEIEWKVKVEHFGGYKVYISKQPIVDLFTFPNHIVEGAKMLREIKNVHQSRCRIEGLEPNTSYYVAVAVAELSTLEGYAQQSFTTLAVETIDGGEVSGEP